MKPIFYDGRVRARCPDCAAISNFVPVTNAVHRDGLHAIGKSGYRHCAYLLVQCSGCDRCGLAELHHNGRLEHSDVEFYPSAIETEPLPKGMPDGVISEYAEAEKCASVGAWRGASALLRSALEKLLKANGYTKGVLAARIEAASKDGIVADALKDRAHTNVRDLGNDVVHDDWRQVTPDEYESAHHYVHRIAEAFYDNRPHVETLLKKAGRLQ